MRVLAAPVEDTREGGFVATIPGELVVRPTSVCDAGRDDACACARTWTGITSGRSTTLAVVREQDIVKREYLDVITAHLVAVASWDHHYSRREAKFLASIAASSIPGTLVVLNLTEDREGHEIYVMEP